MASVREETSAAELRTITELGCDDRGEIVGEAIGETYRVARPVGNREPVGDDREWLRAYRPAWTFARVVLGRLPIDRSWAPCRLERNFYTTLDTQHRLAFGQVAEGKEESETPMIINHEAAIGYMVDVTSDEQIRPVGILALHALLSETCSTACTRKDASASDRWTFAESATHQRQFLRPVPM